MLKKEFTQLFGTPPRFSPGDAAIGYDRQRFLHFIAKVELIYLSKQGHTYILSGQTGTFLEDNLEKYIPFQ